MGIVASCVQQDRKTSKSCNLQSSIDMGNSCPEFFEPFQRNDPQFPSLVIDHGYNRKLYYPTGHRPSRYDRGGHCIYGYARALGRSLQGNDVVTEILLRVEYLLEWNKIRNRDWRCWADLEPLLLYLKSDTCCLQKLTLAYNREDFHGRSSDRLMFAEMIDKIIDALAKKAESTGMHQIRELVLQVSPCCSLRAAALPTFLRTTCSLQRLSIVLVRDLEPLSDTFVDAFGENTSLEELSLQCDVAYHDPARIVWKLNAHPRLRSLTLDLDNPSEAPRDFDRHYQSLSEAILANTTLESVTICDSCIKSWQPTIHKLVNEHPVLVEFNFHGDDKQCMDAATLILALSTPKMTKLSTRFDHFSKEEWLSILAAFVENASMYALSLTQFNGRRMRFEPLPSPNYQRHLELSGRLIGFVLPLLYTNLLHQHPFYHYGCEMIELVRTSYTGESWQVTDVEMVCVRRYMSNVLNSWTHLRSLNISMPTCRPYEPFYESHFMRRNGTIENLVLSWTGSSATMLRVYTDRNRGLRLLLETAFNRHIFPTTCCVIRQTPHVAANNVLKGLLKIQSAS